jgi:hypothetical protein
VAFVFSGFLVLDSRIEFGFAGDDDWRLVTGSDELSSLTTRF